MPPINPLYLRPLVGYAMHHLMSRHRTLKRKLTTPEILELMQAKREWADIPIEEKQLAIDTAVRNVEASLNIRILAESRYTRGV